ncbi:MAG: hypothetical protein ABIA92_00485 [Patescibacteria group bacterium]
MMNENPDPLGDSSDDDETARLRRKAIDALRQTMPAVNDFLCDTRLPAPDTAGHLADYQIRKPQLDAVAQHIREQWLNVSLVTVNIGLGNIYPAGKPYFDIHIDPFSRAEQRRHWPIADDICRILNLSEGEDGGFFFLPTMEPNKYSSEITIYRRDSVEGAEESS